MTVLNYTEPMSQLMNGSLIYAIDTQLQDSTGGMWYIVLFGIPIVITYLKTEDITLSTILLLWAVTLYGYLIDPMLANIATLTMVAGIAMMTTKVFWRDS